MTNQEIAAILEGTARLLELQHANPFRVRSYRNAADRVRAVSEPVEQLLQREGKSALQRLEGIGDKLASALCEIVETGRLGLRDRLEAELSPETLFRRVPGIGPELADRICDELGIQSLEELEQAAHDGRLSRVEGIGKKRCQGIRDALSGMLSRSAARRARQRTSGDDAKPPEPPVSLLLDLDREYRDKAEQGTLPTVTPRRFNPEHEKWLPVMNQKRDGWEFTLLFSNTKRAHDLEKTHDWVVAYYESLHDHDRQDQCTITTAGTGPLRGQRVVRGREAACREYYQQRPGVTAS